MRLFFAVTPDVALRDRLVSLVRELGLAAHANWRVVQPAQLHLTLHFIEHMPAEYGDLLLQHVEQVIDRHPAFSVPLSAPVLFPSPTRPRVVVAQAGVAPALEALAAALRHAARRAGLPAPRRRFRGHITLGRLRGGSAPALPPPQVLPLLDCCRITLYQSELCPAGARHTALEEWPLPP